MDEKIIVSVENDWVKLIAPPGERQGGIQGRAVRVQEVRYYYLP